MRKTLVYTNPDLGKIKESLDLSLTSGGLYEHIPIVFMATTQK